MPPFWLGSVAESEQVTVMALGPARGNAAHENQLSGAELVTVMLNFSGGPTATMRVEAIDSGAPTPTLPSSLCDRVGAEMDFDKVIGYVGQVVDAVGVIAIVLGGLLAIVIAASRLRRGEPDVYSQFRRLLGRSILLGLELLVAGDIIRTVATQPTLGNIAVLAGIVLIRTFLSFSLELEISGRWPWQSANRDEAREPSRP